MTTNLTIKEAICDYIRIIEHSRSKNTARTYRTGLELFVKIIESNNIPASDPVSSLKEDAIVWLISALNIYSPATERLYLTAVTGFYEYLSSEHMFDINLIRIRKLIQLRARRPGQRLPQFPRDDIDKVIIYSKNLPSLPFDNDNERFRNFRDRAFIITLADTGLRVHEACGLRRGDVDWNEGKAIIIGKGNSEDIIRFSSRSLGAIRDYLNERSKLDGLSGRPLASLPLFAQHSRKSGKKIKPISTRTGTNIISQRVKEVLGQDKVGTITPHSFRHFFVTTVLVSSEGNLKLAQELARHRNIAVTQRYAHLTNDELDKGYYKIFEHNSHED